MREAFIESVEALIEENRIAGLRANLGASWKALSVWRASGETVRPSAPEGFESTLDGIVTCAEDFALEQSRDARSSLRQAYDLTRDAHYWEFATNAGGTIESIFEIVTCLWQFCHDDCYFEEYDTSISKEASLFVPHLIGVLGLDEAKAVIGSSVVAWILGPKDPIRSWRDGGNWRTWGDLLRADVASLLAAQDLTLGQVKTMALVGHHGALAVLEEA